jgi:hypothetical protein
MIAAKGQQASVENVEYNSTIARDGLKSAMTEHADALRRVVSLDDGLCHGTDCLTDASSSSDINGDSCGLCHEKVNFSQSDQFITLPCECCSSSTSSGDSDIDDKGNIKNVMCMDCVASGYLKVPSQPGRLLGKCLKCCTSWVSVDVDRGSLPRPSAVNTVGDCTACRKADKLLLEVRDHHGVLHGGVPSSHAREGNISNKKPSGKCEACFLGHNFPLEYECATCEMTQTIYHPMYRYQEGVNLFGKVLWACKTKGGCRNFSTWRIKKDQIG